MVRNDNKILNGLACAGLKPLGLQRRGSSRIWLDDHGWWLVVVEFQADPETAGSYLNVGASWLLHDTSHLGFDVGYRVDTPFIEYEHDTQFRQDAEALVARAAVEVEQMRRRVGSLQLASQHYRRNAPESLWARYYAGVIFGLNGTRDEANAALTFVAGASPGTEWQRQLAAKAQVLLGVLGEPEQFRAIVTATVDAARSSVGLHRWDGESW
ncbi:MAG: hypothetical protein AAGC71_07905 [Pseudomonadota bacterium]